MIIGGSRGCGKTTELIKEANEKCLYIVTASRERAKMIAKTAYDMNLNIPYPISYDELPLKGRFIKEVLVDDVEDVLSSIIGVSVKHASSSHELTTLRPLNKKLFK